MNDKSSLPPPPRIFLSIRWKLCILVVIATSLVALTMYSFMQWSFDRGFLRYINQRDSAQLEKLAPAVTRYYEQYQNWQGLVIHPPRWGELVISALSPRLANRLTQHPPPFRRYVRRFLLFDQDKQLLVGRVPNTVTPLLHSIEYQQQVVGYVGLIPRKELTEFNDIAFAEKHQKLMIIITAIVVIIMALLAIPLASSIVKPIQRLRIAMDQLANRQAHSPLSTNQRDELGLLANDFNILSQLLSQQEQLRKQWLADIAHELRTPISVLQAEMEAIEDGIRPLNQDSIQSLKMDLGRLTHLVNDLHHLALEDIGAVSYQLSQQAIMPILHNMLERHNQLISTHNLALTIKSDISENTTIAVDSNRIQQLFTNLLVNSIHYTDSTPDNPGRIQVSLQQQNGAITITWEDSAPSVPDSALPLLFERLYRVDSARQRDKGGSGLGLAIVKAIVDGHHGTIKAEHSALGGLKLMIALPL
ncbi:ATP-binding protein [Spartinivicinus poritis]|uniref:histidine kinase n=1 Tax=Spartinivicinus poritis TaxID=2994640 RepID=A0ABT5U8L8_9GAMM|nr:ATP-binding protein [Spartinivicinus sp. A2-2]MDE1462700.1 ATP-binding protein [Spartinivicinus sp. A2-2]